MTNPDELLSLLLKGADPRKAKSLKLINDVCEDQRRRGSFDFSVATIGRLSAESGGPAAGAIRNTTGESYRALIKAHLDSLGGKKPKNKPHKADLNPFEGINDPILKARIGILLAEVESLRGQLHAARHLANQHSEVDLRKAKAIENPFTEQEILAATDAFSLKNINANDWIIDDSGRIKTNTGHVVFRPGFTQLITKIIEIGNDHAKKH